MILSVAHYTGWSYKRLRSMTMKELTAWYHDVEYLESQKRETFTNDLSALVGR